MSPFSSICKTAAGQKIETQFEAGEFTDLVVLYGGIHFQASTIYQHATKLVV